MILQLPVPPSTNHLFATFKGRRIITREYKAWRENAGWEIVTQRPKAVTGPVSITLYLPFIPNRDADNFLKPALDLLVTHKLIQSDAMKCVKRLLVLIHGESYVGVDISPDKPEIDAAKRVEAARKVA